MIEEKSLESNPYFNDDTRNTLLSNLDESNDEIQKKKKVEVFPVKTPKNEFIVYTGWKYFLDNTPFIKNILSFIS